MRERRRRANCWISGDALAMLGHDPRMSRTQANNTTRKRQGAKAKPWSHEQFKKAFRTLALDMGAAANHLDLRRRLGDATEGPHQAAFDISPSFWWLTLNAHEDVTLFRICRVYDQDLNALSLRTLLLRIQDTPADARPDEGVAGALGASDPMNKSLASAIVGDLAFVEQSSNDTVKRLMMWRHKEIAHRDETFALHGGLSDKFPITTTEIQQLIDEGMAIINRYYGAFFGVFYSHPPPDISDYERLLAAVAGDLERRRQTLRDEIARSKQEADG